MSFLAPQAPSAPPPPPPPPNPPTFANPSVQASGAATRAAAAAGNKRGFNGTLTNAGPFGGAQGAAAPATTGKALFGS
jgi:hypothetical protein